MVVENGVKYKGVQMEERVHQTCVQLAVEANDVNPQDAQAVLLEMDSVKHMAVENGAK